MEHPCERNLSVGSIFLLGKLSKDIKDRLIGGKVFLRELRDKFSDVIPFKLGCRRYFAGKKTAGNGRKRNNADVMCQTVGKNIFSQSRSIIE